MLVFLKKLYFISSEDCVETKQYSIKICPTKIKFSWTNFNLNHDGYKHGLYKQLKRYQLENTSWYLLDLF